MKDGSKNKILIHAKIEGGNRKDFASRLFQSHYRLLDCIDQAVETVVVLTRDNNQLLPSAYHHQATDTQLSFRYKTYHIFDPTEAELLAMDNFFALIVLTCQKALKLGKVPDTEIGEDRLMIAKAFLKRIGSRSHH